MHTANRQSGVPTVRAQATLCALALAAFSLGTARIAHAQRQSGIQLTPDSQLYLISKDVGTDRWAITYDLATKTVTGNVFPQGGGAPTFVWCSTTSVDQAASPADAQYHLQCSFAPPCESAPCSDVTWTQNPPTDVTVPGSFLLPPNTLATLAGNIQPVIYSPTCATSVSCHVAGGAGPVDLSADVAWGATFRVSATEDPTKFYINPFKADESFLFNKVTGAASPRMPLGGPFLDPAVEDLLRQWILEGAANN